MCGNVQEEKMEVPKDPQRLRRANQRLEAALAAVGNSPAIRRVYDQSDDPPEPIGDLDFTNKDKDDGPGGLESPSCWGLQPSRRQPCRRTCRRRR